MAKEGYEFGVRGSTPLHAMFDMALPCPGCERPAGLYILPPATKWGGLLKIHLACEWCGYFSSTDPAEVEAAKADLVNAP